MGYLKFKDLHAVTFHSVRSGQAPTDANSFACSEIGTELYDEPKKITRNYQAPFIAVTVHFYASVKGLWASG